MAVDREGRAGPGQVGLARAGDLAAHDAQWPAGQGGVGLGEQLRAAKTSGHHHQRGAGQHAALGVQGLPQVGTGVGNAHQPGHGLPAVKLHARLGQQGLHQPRGPNPAAAPVPGGAHARRDAQGCTHHVGGSVAPVGAGASIPVGGQAAFAIHMVLQHAAGLPVSAFLQVLGGGLQRGAHAAARQARYHAVIDRDMGRKHPRWQARGTGCRCVTLVEHLHLPAAPCQAGSHGSTGQARANDDAARGCAGAGCWTGAGRRGGPGRGTGCMGSAGNLRLARLPARVEGGVQVVALGRHTGHFGHGEAALRQVVAHRARHRPGGQARAAPAAARHGLERVQAPHLGVALGAEAIQVHRVHRPVLLAQERLRIANAQRQQHLAAIEGDAVDARQQPPVVAVQLLGQRRQCGVDAGGPQQVVCGHGPGFERDKVQQPGALRVGAPGGPGGEEVQAKAKAGFQNAPLRLMGPGRWQAAAVQKHLARLRQTALFAVVAVAKAGAVGRAVVQPVQGFGHRGYSESKDHEKGAAKGAREGKRRAARSGPAVLAGRAHRAQALGGT